MLNLFQHDKYKSKLRAYIMRIIFMGTPEFSVTALNALTQAGHEILCCYSQPPRRAGRGKKETPSPVYQFALEHDIEVRTPVSLKSEQEQHAFEALNADIAVVVAYGLLLPKAILEGTAHGCLNIHASLLPRWRGAAPIQRAIEAGDKATGVAIMQMDEGLDTGDVLLEKSVPINSETTAGSLHDTLAALGAEMIVEVLANYHALTPTPQQEDGVTYAHKIKKEESLIDWSMDAVSVERKIRAFNPYPSMYFTYNNERIRILKAQPVDMQGQAGNVLDDALTIACGKGAIKPSLVQRQGKQPMKPEELLRGFQIKKGESLS